LNPDVIVGLSTANEEPISAVSRLGCVSSEKSSSPVVVVVVVVFFRTRLLDLLSSSSSSSRPPKNDAFASSDDINLASESLENTTTFTNTTKTPSATTHIFVLFLQDADDFVRFCCCKGRRWFDALEVFEAFCRLDPNDIEANLPLCRGGAAS
jgi:hypothetical protein